MKNVLFSRLLAVMLLAAGALPVSVTSAAAQAGCWDNAAIQAALSEGRIQPVSRVLAREGIPPSTQVVSVRVCEEGGSPVYVLGLLDASGEARSRTFGAR